MSGHGADWYKREPETWLGGVRGMSARQICVYAVVIDLIYQDGGRTLDNPKFIAGIIGDMGQAAVRRTLNELCELGPKKLYRRDGYLHNEMADATAKTREALSEVRSAAAKGESKTLDDVATEDQKPDENQQKTEEKPRENEQKTDDFFPVFSQENSENPNKNSETDNNLPSYARSREGEGDKIEEKETPSGVSKKTAHRIEPDFWPSGENWIWAINELGFTQDRLKFETEHMKDHFEASNRPTARKIDWQRTWRNWMREAWKRGKSNAPRQHTATIHEIARADVAGAKVRP